MIERTDPADPTESADAKLPIEQIEHAEPIEPIESTEPLDPMDKNEFSDHNDQREVSVFMSHHVARRREAPSGRRCHTLAWEIACGSTPGNPKLFSLP